MRNFNEFSALWRAPIFNRAFYQDVAWNWRGIGVRYLLLLVMLTWFAVLIQWTVGMTNFLNTEAPKDLATFPTIHITKGVVTSDAPQPYIMKGDRGEPLFVLDTTGTVTQPADVGAMALLTSTELIQDTGGGRVQRHPLAGFPDMTIDRPTISGWLGTLRNWMIPGGLVCCGDFSLAYRLIAALLFALVGMAFNSAFHAGLKYPALIRLSVVAMTGPILADTLLSLLRWPSACGLWFVFHLITLAYLAFAIKAAAAVAPQPPSEYAPEPTPDSPIPPPPPEDFPPGSDQFP